MGRVSHDDADSHECGDSERSADPGCDASSSLPAAALDEAEQLSCEQLEGRPALVAQLVARQAAATPDLIQQLTRPLGTRHTAVGREEQRPDEMRVIGPPMQRRLSER